MHDDSKQVQMKPPQKKERKRQRQTHEMPPYQQPEKNAVCKGEF